MNEKQSIRLVSAVVFACVSLFLSVWIVLPAYTRQLLVLTVGAPEVSVWFMVLAIVALLFVVKNIRRSRLSQVVVAMSMTSLGLSALPFLRFPGVASSADLAMRTALGGTYLDHIPASVRARMARTPLSPVQLFLGFDTPRGAITTTTDVIFRTVGGEALTVDIYQPSDSGLRPVLVQVYGGAWQRGAPSDYAEFASYFAHQGYVVVAIDYRHAPEFTYLAQIDDVRYALSWVVANAGALRVDTSRVALVGRSAGAHLAMMAAYSPDAPHVRAVVNFYGPVDLIEGYESPPHPDPLDVRSIERAFIGGTPSTMRAQYRDASPIALVNRQLPPTLLLYGQRDHIVLPRFGDLLAGRLRAEGTVVVHVEIPWADHAFDTVPHGPSGQLSRYLIEHFLAWAMNNDPVRDFTPANAP